MTLQIKIAPSLLTADLTRLGAEIEAVIEAGADIIHVDVMDGAFVPNLTVGPLIVRALQSITQKTNTLLEAHLMIEKPERMIPAFAEAGAQRLIVHAEACDDLPGTIKKIKKLGVQPGVTVKPNTPLSTIEAVLSDVDLVLIMSVEPGYGGQSYIPGSTDKIKRLRAMLDDIGSKAELEVDGGIKPDNLREVVEAGASVVVIGSAIFNDRAPIAANVQALREALT